MAKVIKIHRILTDDELDVYSKRIDEISDLFDTELPEDVHDNLTSELEGILLTIESSLSLAEETEAREAAKKRPRIKKITFSGNLLEFKRPSQ